jgi:4,5-dihydroxyphthalate decarboxylase
MTPFMPAGFHDPDSPLRHLLRDYRSAEISYYGEVGYVPGIHLVTVRRESVAARPGLPAELTRSLEASTRAWTRQRVKLADTTPWLLAEIETTAATTGLDWMPYGVAANAAMVEDFVDEMHAQGLLSTRPALEDLFSEYLAVEEAA